uniref:Uncharacterized protein n=1 Tax=Lepeophtheirus salmonis TaxID=72036 RepID=A0A0K2VGE1_LEPSM
MSKSLFHGFLFNLKSSLHCNSSLKSRLLMWSWLIERYRSFTSIRIAIKVSTNIISSILKGLRSPLYR